MTSHDVVNRVRRLFGVRRVGHAGTLDPLATGVLVVCLGIATRVVEYLTAGRKTYIAGVVFGETTDTEDATGHIVSQADASWVTIRTVEAALPLFRGRIRQIPPMVSAVHHEGKRLYELARQGLEVERLAREVTIYRLELLSFVRSSRPRVELEVECSAGTYIRTLAAGIGEELGVGGMMGSLRRTRSGAFSLADSHSLEALQRLKDAGDLAESVRGIAEALSDWERVTLTPAEVDRIAHGQPVSQRQIPGSERVLLVDESGAAVAIGRPEGSVLQPEKVLVTP